LPYLLFFLNHNSETYILNHEPLSEEERTTELNTFNNLIFS